MNSPGSTLDHPCELRERWRQLQAERSVRNRDAAEALGVSEAALIASLCGDGATRLQREPLAILREASMLGRVMALTRNASVVHEKKGVYAPASGEGHMGLVLGDDIDLRLFFNQWVHAFAVTEPGDKGDKQSLQFFDAAGEAVHKIHLQPQSDTLVFDAIATHFAHENQASDFESVPRKAPAVELPDDKIAAQAFREGWAALQDTHEFFGLLRKFEVTRTQALRLADGQHARRVGEGAVRTILENAAATSVPIMVFVGNPGCIQIHTGPVANVAMMGPWLNVLDADFNLHLRTDHVAQSWVVRKPTTEGIVTSLELFDANGVLIAQFFGKRKPGIPEHPAWRELLEPLPTVEASHAR